MLQYLGYAKWLPYQMIAFIFTGYPGLGFVRGGGGGYRNLKVLLWEVLMW